MAIKSKEQRKYLLRLKNEISSFLVNYKRKYQRFPWSQINKVSKVKLYSSVAITVNGTKFTVKELVKLLNTNKKKINGKLKASSYNYILKAYIRDSYKQSGSSLKSVYSSYHLELQKVFKEMDYDLLFCLNGLKELNKALKNSEKQRKLMKESTDESKKLHLSLFDKKKLDKAILTKYKGKYSFLKHVDIKDDSYVWFDENKIVAILMVDEKDGDIWITGIEVSKEYRGRGLGSQILKFAIQGLKANALSVRKTNDIAIKMYKKAGFVDDGKDHGSMYFMFLSTRKQRKNVKESEDIDMTNDELLLAIIESEIDYCDDDVFEEGANVEIISEYNKIDGRFCLKVKDIKKALKEKNIKEAKKNLKELKREVKKSENIFDSIKSTDLEAIIGYLLVLLIRWARYLILIVPLGPSAEIAGLYSIVDEMVSIAKTVKRAKKEGLSIDTMNFLKSRLKSTYTKFYKEMDKLEKKIDKIEKEEKEKEKQKKTEKKNVKESEDIDMTNDELLTIIESEIDDTGDVFFEVESWGMNSAGMEKLRNVFNPVFDRLEKKSSLLEKMCDANIEKGNVEEARKCFNSISNYVNNEEKKINVMLNKYNERYPYRKFYDASRMLNHFKQDFTDGFENIKMDLKKLKSKIDKCENSKPVKESEDIEMTNDELLLAIIESEIDECDDDVFEEGANIESLKYFRNAKKEFKKLSKEYKKNIKAGNFKEARKNVNKMKESLNSTLNLLDETDGGAGSMILGFCAELLKSTLVESLIFLPTIGLLEVENKISAKAIMKATVSDITGISAVGSYVGALIFEIKKVIKDIIGIINELKKPGDVTADNSNIYRNNLKANIKKMIKIVEKLNKNIDKLEKEYDETKKEQKNVKESEDIEMNTDELLLAIIESEIDYCDDDVFEEGANKDIREELNTLKRDYKTLTKKCKEHIRNNEFDKAKRDVKVLKGIIEKVESKIKQLDSTAGDVALSISISIVKDLALGMLIFTIGNKMYDKNYLPYLKKSNEMYSDFSDENIKDLENVDLSDTEGVEKLIGRMNDRYKKNREELDRTPEGKKISRSTMVKDVGLSLAIIKTTIDLVKNISTSIKRAKEDGKITPDTFNTYKNRVLECIGKIKKDVDKLEKSISDAEKKFKTMKESEDIEMNTDELLLAIIESEIDYCDDEVIEEAANKDIRESMKKLKRDYRDLTRICKEHIKNNEFDKAKKDVKALNTMVDKLEKEVKDMDSTAGDAALSMAAEFAKEIAVCTLLLAPSIVVKKVGDKKVKDFENSDDVKKNKEAYKKADERRKEANKKISEEFKYKDTDGMSRHDRKQYEKSIEKIESRIKKNDDRLNDSETYKKYKEDNEKMDTMSRKIQKTTDILSKSGIRLALLRVSATTIKNVCDVIRRAKENGKITPDTFNMYKAKVLDCISNLKKDVAKLEKAIEVTEKECKKVLKESFDEEIDNEFLLMITESLVDYNDDEDEVLTEGANTDLTKEFRDMSKRFNVITRDIRKALKEKDTKEAGRKVKQLKTVVKQSEARFNSIKSDGLESVIGFVCEWLRRCVQMFIVGCVSVLANVIVGEGPDIKTLVLPSRLYSLTEDIIMIKNTIKRVEQDGLTADTLNIYKTKIGSFYKRFYKEIENFEKDIDKVEKKLAKLKKESFDEEIDNEFLLMITESLVDYNDDEDEVLTEGANLESRKIVLEAKKAYKKLFKEYKKNVKSANFKEARKNVKDMKVVVTKAGRLLDNEKGGVDSAILGFFATFVKDFMVGFTAALPGSIGMGYANALALRGKVVNPVIGGISIGAYNVGMIVSALYAVKTAIKDTVSIVNAIKKEKVVTADVFNRYRNRLSQKIDEMLDSIDKMNDNIDSVEAAYKEALKTKRQSDKVAKESADFDAEKLAIYEACHNGEITVEEREELLHELENKKYINESTEVEEGTITDYEKFGKVAEVLYERCANGEISIEERENLLLKAKEMIL